MCGQSDGSFSPTETAGRPGERGMRAMTRPPKTPHLGVALAIALVCLAYAGVARAQVVAEPVSEPPAAPAEPPAEVTDPVSEPPAAPAEPPAEVTDPVSEPPAAPAEPPAEVTDPVSEPPAAPAEPPAEVTDPVSEPPAAPAEPPAEVTDPVSEPPAAPAASGSGDSIVVINSASTTPGIDAAFSVPSPDSSAGAVIGREPSAPRSDSGRGKRPSPSVLDPQRLPPEASSASASACGRGSRRRFGRRFLRWSLRRPCRISHSGSPWVGAGCEPVPYSSAGTDARRRPRTA